MGGSATIWPLVALAILVAVLAWGYWPTFGDIVSRWANDSKYSHGYFVPAFALYLLRYRKDKLRGVKATGHIWGLAFLTLGVAMHLLGARTYYEWLSTASFLPCLAGLCLGLGGWKVLAWAWPAIVFLGFMLPLPFRVEVALALPLQRLATTSSVFVLQLLGLPAVAEGNIIIMEETTIGVVEACNGLGMLVTFFAVTTGLAFLVKSWLEKAVLVLSSIPVALAANVCRITVTGLIAEWIGRETANEFHNSFLAAFFSMVVALGLVGLELWLLNRLFPVVSAHDEPVFIFAKRKSVPPAKKPSLVKP
ncbi:MAG TPA: exosortase/archaeosortase family protein [Gemmataceae bacterium]|nr:exosortase/archaeosortase family protein [Gemmataceae bacterium]